MGSITAEPMAAADAAAALPCMHTTSLLAHWHASCDARRVDDDHPSVRLLHARARPVQERVNRQAETAKAASRVDPLARPPAPARLEACAPGACSNVPCRIIASFVQQ